jgi:hypothetical protein
LAMEDCGIRRLGPLKEDCQYQGIAGWLLVFLIGIFLRACVGFVDTAAILHTVAVQFQFLAPDDLVLCLVALVVTGLTFVFFPLCCTFVLFKRSRNAVDLVRIWLLVALGVEIGFAFIGRNAEDPGSTDIYLVGELIYVSLSYSYFSFSKRIMVLYGASEPSKWQIAIAGLLFIAALGLLTL